MRSLAGPAVVLALLVSLFSAVGLTEHASAAEPDEIGAAEGRETPSQPVSTDTICSALAAAAAQNDLPTDFFAKSAKFLRDLRREFGNLGLAAAAYNAGSGRVRDWLAGRRALPRETTAYVRIVTGYSPEQWAGPSAGMGEMKSEKPVPCGEIAAFIARAPPPASKPTPVWGVELVGGPTDETALAAYRRVEQKYPSILVGRQAYVVHHGLGRGSMGWAHVHVGADDRPSAEKLCADLRGAGVTYCEVQRARSTR